MILEETELFQLVLTRADSPATYDSTPLHITILDDEDLTYVIEGDATIGEDAGNYTVQLRRTGDITADAMVAYTVSGGSGRAAEAADFAGNTFTDGNFVFTGYDALSDEITFTIENDGDSEGAETFQISVNGGTPSTTKSKEVTIDDDDAQLVTVGRVGSDSGPVNEGDMIMLEVALKEPGVVADGNLTVNLAARVTAASNGGTAADVTIPATVTIPNGMSKASFAVSAVQDSIAEYDEIVNIYVSHVNTAPIDDNGYNLMIASDANDKIMASLAVLPSSNLNEGGTANIRITLTAGGARLPSSTPANALSLVLSDSANDGMDVTIPLTDITPELVSGSTYDVAIALDHDDLLEALETIELELRIDSTKNPDLEDVLDVSGASTSFMLADADMGQVSITTSGTPSFTEDQSVMVTVELPSGLTAGANITIAYDLIVIDPHEDGKASTADIDGDVMGRVVTIMKGDRTAVIMIDLVDNDGAELTEQLGIRLTSASGATGVSADNSETNVLILDNEPTEYTLVGDATVVEGVAYTVRLSRIGTIVSDAMVTYTIGDAPNGNDVDITDFGGTFPTGNFMFSGDDALSDEVTIATGDDDDLEPDETFQISVNGGTPSTTKSKEVTITNDDKASAEIQIGTSSGTIAEGASTMLVVALTNAPDGATEDLTVHLLARAHTSDPDGGTAADVTIPASVMIPKGAGSVPLMVSAFNDDDVEYDETVNIYVSMVGSDSASDSGVDLTIESEDQITVTALEVLGTSILTEGNMATVRITLSDRLPSRTLAGALSLILSDSTNDGLDVDIPAPDITPDLKSMATFEVEISLLDDTLLEDTERIELGLQIASGQDPDLADVLDVSVAEASTSFMLSDADSGRVTAALSKTTYNENEDVMVTVSLPSGLTAGADIYVDYELDFTLTNDGGTTRVSADIDDIEGTSSIGRVTIMTGAVSAIFTIDLDNDLIAEETELLGVGLTGASGAMSVMYDDTVMQLRILDDDEPEYTLEGTRMVNENPPGIYTVQARRRGRTDVLSVGYTVTVAATNSASAADFTGGVFPTGSFTFSGNDALSTNMAMIGIEDDTLLEDVENFLIVAGNAMHPVMLFDNDAPTVFVDYPDGVSSITFEEGQSVDLVAVLQNAPNGATEELTVSLAAREVSGATDSGTPDDVEFPWWSAMTTPTITIPVGASKVTFAVKAVADGLAEYTETVNIYASQVAYGSKSRNPGDSGSKLTIVSKDQIVAELEVLEDADELVEGSTINIRVKLNQQLPDRTPARTLALVLQDGSFENDYVRIISPDLTTDLKTDRSTDVMVELKENTCLIDVTAQFRLRIASSLLPLLPTGASTSFDIIDNDPGTLSVVPVGGDAHFEGATIAFEVKLPPGITACTEIEVDYDITGPTSDGTRTPAGPGDSSITTMSAVGFAQGLVLPVRGFAQMGGGPLMIMPGQNSVLLRIQLTDDTTPEEAELLGIRLMGVSGDAKVEYNSDMETVITILDNEDPVLQIIGSRSVNEEDGRYTVRLRRLGRIDQDGEIPYTIVGEGADDGDFVGALTGKFEFNGYEPLSELVIVPLEDDRSAEGSKTFQIMVERADSKTKVEYVAPGTYMPYVDPVTGMPVTGFAVTLLDSDVADFFGALPPTGGPVLPIWLVLLLALTGIALLVPTLRYLRTAPRD